MILEKIDEAVDGMTEFMGHVREDMTEKKSLLEEIRDYVINIFELFEEGFDFNFDMDYDDDGEYRPRSFWAWIAGKIVDTIGAAFDAGGSIANAIASAFETVGGVLTGAFDFLKEPVNNIVNYLLTLLDYLNPVSPNFFLKVAFIPEQGFFNTQSEKVKTELNVKVPILGQMTSLFTEMSNIYSSFGEEKDDEQNNNSPIAPAMGIIPAFEDGIIIGGGGNGGGSDLFEIETESSGRPSIKIKLPESFGGGEYEAVNFSFFDQYRRSLHGFILAVAWFLAIRTMFRRYAHLV
jgi:hypothetical protein